MLEVRKSTTLSGTISLEEETAEGTQKIPVLYITSSISEEGLPSTTESYQNKQLYLANKETIRQDINEFKDMVDNLM